jgi:hypothetical protein
MSFFTLSGTVLSLLNTGISAGAELLSFGSRRGHLNVIPISSPQFQSSKIPIVPGNSVGTEAATGRLASRAER